MDPTTPGMCWHTTLWKYLIWCNRYNSLKFKLPEITMFKMTKANSHTAYKIQPLKVGLYSRWKNSFENRLRFDKIMAMCSVCSFWLTLYTRTSAAACESPRISRLFRTVVKTRFRRETKLILLQGSRGTSMVARRRRHNSDFLKPNLSF